MLKKLSCCLNNINTDLFTFTDKEECFICWDIMCEPIGAKCFVCKIVMHDHCSTRLWNGQGYTKCPHCSNVGRIGGVYNKNLYDK